MTSSTERRIAVGRAGRPHGLHGAFAVENASADPERLAVGARILVGDERVTVVERKHAGGRLVIRLDREVPRGVELEIYESELSPTGEGEYYAFQLEGLAVVGDDGRPIGCVTAVEPGVANDVLELDSGLGLPLVEDCVLEIDLERRRIVVARSFAGYE
ncbi:MAG: ribosome maturation factor RimM [Gaiellales bacterium]